MKPENFEDVPQINEHNFVKNYLPLLLDNENPNGRMRWVEEVAIQPTLAVEVVDDEDHSKVLYRVPPLVYTPETQVGTNMGNIINKGLEDTRHKRNPAFLNGAVSALREVIDASEPPQEDLDAWKFILTRYGYLPKTDSEEGESGAQNNRPAAYEEADW
ncbi:hypothetical protein CZP2022_195 [Vibrio phage C-ZP2022]|nr:hypothetical protein CZP2022_195 [Vibrio phage C-ZP2022]